MKILSKIGLFLCTTIFTAVFLEYKPLHRELFRRISQLRSAKCSQIHNQHPLFAVYIREPNEEHLFHVFKVLNSLGYKRGNIGDEWDLLWAHDYPFLNISLGLKKLESQQVVNHFPGCGFITNKVDLSTTPLPFIPRSFRLPSEKEEFLSYALSNKSLLFVEKRNDHRQIFLRSPDKINLNSTVSFVQEYIQNPLLVDGYKFDIGVYVVITSVDPLRIYLYSGDVLFRYCPHKYHPFNPEILDKYVVADDYLPTWEVPSLVKYFTKFSGSMRGSFDAYLRNNSIDPSIIWVQVENIIRSTILLKEHNISQLLHSYKTRNFFELIRFDMIIDNQLRVHLIEANMSPNLSSAHFKPNAILYEQVLYSTLSLVGVGSAIKKSYLRENVDDIANLVSTEQNLATQLNKCIDYNCDHSCNNQNCDLCLPCMSGSDYQILENAHREHLHRISMKRIFPTPILDLKNFNIETAVKKMSIKNSWMTRWFYYKCRHDHSWCT